MTLLQSLKGASIAALALSAAAPALAQDASSLASCPARQPVLRVSSLFAQEEFSPHPVQTRFSSPSYSRLYLTPLFSADPWEEKVDAKYGVAVSWTFMPGAKGMEIRLRKGLIFNDGEPITARDVVFSIKLFSSDFAEDQIRASLRGIGLQFEIIDDHTLKILFNKGNVTFPQEFSTMVFPIYVTSEKHHSNGEISEAAVEKFKTAPLATGPYRVVSRQALQGMTLEAARKDPLLGCPKYDRIEFRHVPETGARVAALRTGQTDIIAGDRDLIPQMKSLGATVAEKPGNNMIGLYIFQSGAPGNVFGDVRVRKAAAHAIDHKLIGETIFKSAGISPWGCTWPPSTEVATADPNYLKACGTPYPYDPATAKKLMAEAGLAGRKVPIKLAYWGNFPEEPAFAEAIQPMLNEVGFDATIDKIDRAEFNRRVKNNGFVNQLMFFGPGGRITSLTGSYFTYGADVGPRDKDVDAALASAAGAASLEDYMAATAEIGKLAFERAYSPGFFQSSSIFFLRRGLTDWGLSRSKGRGTINLVPLVADLRQ